MTSLVETVFPSSKTLVESVNIFTSSSSSQRNTPFGHVARSTTSTQGVAEVVRSLSLGLKAGPNKVIITGLSSSIDKRSVRVSMKGGPATRLFDLVCTTNGTFSNLRPLDGSPENSIAILRAKRKLLEKIKRIHEHESLVLFEYGKSLKSENHVGSEQVANFLQTFSEKAKQSVEEEARLEEEIESLDKQIQEQEHTLKAKVGEAKGQVELVVVAENDGQVEIKLTYVVSGASWKSVYELHAKNINGKPLSSVLLNYNAQVTQGTGEDWKDTVIKLSTSSNDLRTSRTIPQLHGVKVQASQVLTPQLLSGTLRQPAMAAARKASAAAPAIPVQTVLTTHSLPQPIPADFSYSHSSPKSVVQQYSSAAHVDDAPARQELPMGHMYNSPRQLPQAPSTSNLPESSVIVMKSSVSLVYAVKGLTSIPSDGLPHQVPVAKLPFEANISHVSVPWVEPNVYLRCSIKNTSDYKIFSGSVNILFDDALVSISSLQDVDIGDEFECSLGTDPDVYVTYSREHSPPKTEGGGFSETFKSTDVLAKISIRNKHAYKIEELYIQDGVPIPSDKAFKVLLQKPEGLAEAEGDGKIEVREGVSVRWKGGASGKTKGLFEWTGFVDAGESLDLEAGWVVRAPEHVDWKEIKA